MDKELTVWEKAFRETINKHIYIKNDKAHDINHVDEVWNNIIDIINNSNKIGYDRNVLFLGVYLHDMGCWIDREKHNEIAYSFIMDRTWENLPAFNVLKFLKNEELNMVADMVLWHRASLDIRGYNGKYLEYVNLIRAADKGKPNFDLWFNRALEYAKGDLNKTVKHLKDKYGPDGYMWKNDPYYKDLFKHEYEQFQKELKEIIESQEV